MFVVPASVFFLRIQARSVEKVAILFGNLKGETTLIFNFRTRAATGYSPRNNLPALFCTHEAEPYTTS